MATKTFACDKDAMDRLQTDGVSTHRMKNGGDKHLMVGQTQQGVYAFIFRSYIHFAMDWSGVGKITAATLHLRTSLLGTANGNKHTGTVGSIRTNYAQVLNAAFTEPVDGEYDFWVPNGNWAVPAQEPARDAALKVQFTSPLTQGADFNVNVVALVEALAPTTVKRRDGTPGGAKTNHGLALVATSEANQALFAEFFGRSNLNLAAARPYITLTYEPANRPPNKPTAMTPSGSIVPGGATAFEGTFTDPDAGDKLHATNIKVYDQSGGTLLWDQTLASTSGEQAAGRFSVPIPALIRSGVQYEWEARVQDPKGLWSLFSPRVSFRFTNAKPTLSALIPNGASFASLSHVTFRATYSDPDSDPMGQYRIQLRVPTAPGHPDWDADTNNWDTGDVTPTSEERDGDFLATDYGGGALVTGSYAWRARAADKWGEVSDWVYGTITLTADWNPDPGSLDFLTGYGKKPPRPRILIRAVNAAGTRGPLNPPVAIIEDAANIGGSAYHNAAGEVYFTLPATHPQVGVIEPYQVHYAVEIYHGDRWREVFAGVVTDFDATDDDVVFYGTDYLGMTDKVVDSRYNPAAIDAPAPTGSKYTDKTITEVINDQLTMAKGKTNSPIAFIAHSTYDVFPEKVTIWSTFVSVFSFITGLMESHQQGTGKRSRLWVQKNTAGYQYLLKDNPGVERPNIRLEYGGLVQGFRLTAFGEFATFAHGIGKARDGANLYYTSEQGAGIDPAVWGRIETIRLWDDVTDKNDLQRRLKQQAARSARIGKRIAMALRVDTLQPFDGWDIGDHVLVDIVRGVVNTNAYGSGYWTIMGVEWFAFPDGHTDMTLVVLPREDNVPPDTDLIPTNPIYPNNEWGVGYVPPVQGTNTSKLYLDLTTGKTYQLNPDGTYTEVTTPPLPDAPTLLSLTTFLTYDATGDPVIKVTATLIQPAGTNNRGSWVEITSTNDGLDPPSAVWDDTAVLLFIPAGENSVSFEGVAGNTLYFARAWSVDFVGVPSTKTASEQIISIKDEIAPPVPSDAVTVGSIKAILSSWTPSNSADLAFYEFRYAEDDGSGTGPGGSPTWVVQRARTTFIYVGNLGDEQRYWCQVRAIDRSGNVDDNGVTRNYADFPDVGYTALESADTTLVNADLIALGAVEPQHIAYLTADMIQSGILRINTSQTSMFDGIKIYGDDGVTEIGRWDDTGLYIRSATDSSDYIHISDAALTVYLNGAPMTVVDETGLNASAITNGTMPGNVNLLRNSSFEMGGFSTATINNTVWTADADWDSTRVGTDTNITENAGDRQQAAATF